VRPVPRYTSASRRAVHPSAPPAGQGADGQSRHATFHPAAGKGAAIIIEPVQGEGGFYAASPAFMQRLRALCDQHSIMLIADEVQ
ncbi:aminotransferase class III-fold pyridoxal phosphate-dependent enzyme, partial [Salmonella enterica subsp. enterica serovar Montevideo]|nr:aminotransferase class III-fold pyridoxal phosphate-dependent enzyme [Salmonella enterica subsp. enterica serovar Montevideo]